MKKYFSVSWIIIPVLLLSLGLVSCGSAQQSKNEFVLKQNPPFKIVEAYYQKWVAGVKEGGAGVNVHLIFDKLEPNVDIKEVFFRGEIKDVQKSQQNDNLYVAGFTRDLENDVIMDVDPIKESQNTPSKKFPFDLKGDEAVIGYLFNGSKQYYKLSNIPEKRQISYPQSNPTSRN